MMSDLKLVLNLLREQKGISFLIILSVISSLLSLMPMFFIGKAIDYISGNSNISLSIIFFFLFLFFLFSSFSIVIRNAFGYFSSNYISRIIFNIRKRIFRTLTTPSSYLDSNISTSDKIYRTLNDTQNIDYVISQPLTTSAADVMDIIWVSAIMIIISPWLVLSSWIILPILFYGSWKISKIQAKLQNQLQVSEATLLDKSKRSIQLLYLINCRI